MGDAGARRYFSDIQETWGSYERELVDVIDASPAVVAVVDIRAVAKTSGVPLERRIGVAFWLRDDRIAVHAMHPGWADTPGLETGLPGFRTVLGPVLRSPDQGADTIVWLAAAEHPGRVTGRFWLDRAPRSTSKLVPSGATPQAREALWDRCERLCGVDAS